MIKRKPVNALSKRLGAAAATSPSLRRTGKAMLCAIGVSCSWFQATVVLADNFGLGAAYSFSRPPLYNLTLDEGDALQLTDGKLVRTTMWMSREAVGWIADAFPITIEVDLGGERAIGKVCVRSVRGTQADVSLPERVDLFVSVDKRRYGWGGHILPFDELGDGEYLARDFCFADLGQLGRYVRLQVTTSGRYFFTDEITVWSSEATSITPSVSQIAAADVGSFVLQHRALSLLVADAQAQLARDASAAASRARLDKVAQELASGADRFSLSQLSEMENKVRGIVRDGRLAEGRSLELVRADPWALATPLDGAPRAKASYPLLVPAGGHGAIAVAIEHTEAEPLELSIQAAIVDGPASSFKITPYEVAIVTRADAVRMGDPLVPLRGRRLSVQMGETRQVWLDVEAAPASVFREAIVRLQIEAVTLKKKQMRSLDVPVATYVLSRQDKMPAVVAWGYLDMLPVRGRTVEASRDMLAHGINTAVVPSWYTLPWPHLGAEPGDAQIGDYRGFDEVMSILAGHQRYLFFLGFNSDSNVRSFGRRHVFLSEGWKSLFIAWVREWTRRLRAAGLDYRSFALYPIDEPHAGPEHDALVAVAQLVKQADPQLQVYTTLHDPKALSEVLIDAIDIFQLNGRAFEAATISRLQGRGKTVWSYATNGGGKAGHPATFYRAQAWSAFVQGVTGFGFWAYADTGRRGTAWNDIDGDRPDFAVIYDSPTGIVSSKRWEAWREGVQDFALLSTAKGAARTEAERRRVDELARRGLDKISDEAEMAEVRRSLLAVARR